jgi:integrase
VPETRIYGRCQKCGDKWDDLRTSRYCDSCLRKNLSLSIYRRHKQKCPERADRTSRKCRCQLWATNILNGKPYRRSLHTGDWEEAFKKIQHLEHGHQPQRPNSITIKAALDAFIKDCEQRNLTPKTLSKYRTLQSRLIDFASEHEALRNFGAERVRGFRSTWKLAPLTASKELGHLRNFFRFCQDNGWLQSNPAKSIKAPQVKINPRLPFSELEIQNILSKAKDDRELAFILTLRHTGLRIGDASLLKVSQVSNGRIHLYTTKAGTPVSILIPKALASLLNELPPNGGYFFLRGDSIHPHSTSDSWRKRIKAICKTLKILPDHPHRFRHSLAADLLTKGVSVENVAAILGNSPAIVVKHYSQWISSRQEALDAALELTWKPTLQIVKSAT